MAKRLSDDDINNSSIDLRSGSKVHITLRYKQSRRSELSVQRHLTPTEVPKDSCYYDSLGSLSVDPTDQVAPNTFVFGEVNDKAAAGPYATLDTKSSNVIEAAASEQQNVIDSRPWRPQKLPERRLPNEYVALRNQEAMQLCGCETCLGSGHPCYRAQLLLLDRENRARKIAERERRMEQEEHQWNMEALKDDQDYQRQLAALEAQNKARIMMEDQQTNQGITFGTVAPPRSPSAILKQAEYPQTKLLDLKQDATNKISSLERDFWSDRRQRSAQSRAQIERELACLQQVINEHEMNGRVSNKVSLKFITCL
jgi:hypothetical protein